MSQFLMKTMLQQKHYKNKFFQKRHFTTFKLQYPKVYPDYLGYMIDSSLSDREHIKMIFTSFRKNMMVFKSLVKVRKIEILLRLFRTFVQPSLHSLEFIDKFTPANVQRYDYLVQKFLGVKNVAFRNLVKENPWISLENQLKYAKIRYDEI